MRSKKLFTVFLAIAGLFLFTVPSVYAAFTDVSAATAYADLQDPNTDAVIIDVRTVDERNGLIPPWSGTPGTIDTNSAYNGTPKWRVNGKTYLPISIPWWIDENTPASSTSPDDPTEVTNIIEGLLERGVINFNTKLYFLCRTAVRSHDMATWIDGRTFTSTRTGSGTFTNLYDIDEPSTLYDGGMQEWNASNLPKYMGTSWSNYTYTPPMVFATFDGTETFTVSVLEPSNGAGFTEPTINRVSLQIFDANGLKGSEVAFSTTDTVAGTLWTDYTFKASTYPFDIPNGSYTWRAYAANNPGRGLANNALGVTDISAADAQSAAASGDGIIIDVRSVEEHSNFTQNWASTGACTTPNVEAANSGAPMWVDSATGVTIYSPNVPFWISSGASGHLPENTTEFENALAALKEAGVIDFNTKIYFICRSGYRSYWAGVYAEKLGFRNVYNIDGADTYNSGGMLEWSAASLAKYESADWAPPPQVYAISPADGYANAATGSFTVGILEPTWGCSTLGYPEVCNVDLKVDGATAASSTTDTVAGTLWTKYTLSYTPAAGSHTWNAYAFVDFNCDGTGSSDEAWSTTSSYAAADDIALRRTLDVSTSIAVTDSVGTADDLEMNYGDVTVDSSSASQTITVTNNGTSLTMSDTSFATLGQAKFDPFTITDNCSTAGTLANGGTCTVDVVFSPTTAGSFGKIIRINSDDATVPQVSVAMCGTGGGTAPRWTYSTVADTSDLSDSDLLSLLSDCAVPAVTDNSAPTAPELLYPADGDVNVPTSVTFAWTESADADGDAASYQICYAPEGTDLDSNCYPVPVGDEAARGTSNTLYAGLASGAGLLLFGVVLAGSARRRKLALLIALMAITAMFLVSCGKSTTDTSSNNGTDNFAAPGIQTYPATLDANTSYTWKVIASDGQDSSSSDVASFTTGD